MTKTQKFLIIDANSLIHRAYHALPPLTTKDGRLVNAVYGFISIFLKVLREHKPDYLAVCFDVAGKTFRDDIYSEYKAGREEKPDEFYAQFDLIREFLETYNVAMFEKEGYEADDIIGTLAGYDCKLQIANCKLKKIILSGDKDMLQLVNNDTEVELTKRGVSDTATYTRHSVREEFGFDPEYITDYKGLRGDSSDNIPGVKGVGEKTATELITEFGSLENIYETVKKESGKIKPGTLKKLIEHEKSAFMSKKLATIKRDVKLRYTKDDIINESPNYDAVVNFMQELGFKSLLNKIPKPETESLFEQQTIDNLKNRIQEKTRPKNITNNNYVLVDSDEKFKDFLKDLKKQKEFAIDTETTSVNVIDAELLGMSFSWKAGAGYYLSIFNSPFSIFNELRPILENPNIKKIGHNIKYDYQVLKQAGINLNGISFDSMIAAYLINPGSRGYSLDALAFSEFGHQMIPISSLIGEKKNAQISMKGVPIEKLANYAIEDADYTWRLYLKLSKDRHLIQLKKVFEEIEIPLIRVLGDMELRGVKIDDKFLKNMSAKLKKHIDMLEKKIYKLAGRKFNVASPAQLKEVLFDEIGISTEGLKRTKTGVSTAASELEKMRGRHEIIDLITEFREISKLKNTYTDALPRLINPTTKRLHTNYNQTITATGRLSSTDPNLQNIPIRTELGAQIRNAFVAKRGFKLVAADYSQIELRIVASLSGDRILVDAFNNGEDIHRTTASRVFDTKPENVTDQQRRIAKVVNFGILYGLGSQGLARSTGMSVKEAKDYLDKYFKLHGKLKQFIEKTKKFARTKGYTKTQLGRRRYFPELQGSHPALIAQSERAAVNLPIQGLSADIIKLAMIELNKKIHEKGWETDVKMLLQIHDELVFEVRTSMVDEAERFIKKTMENVYKLNVPIIVDTGVGKSWGECK